MSQYLVIGEEYACDDCWVPVIVCEGSYADCELSCYTEDYQYRNKFIISKKEWETLDE